MSDGDRGGGNRVVMTRTGESADSANQGQARRLQILLRLFQV
jgi:hypothetical protein